MWNIKLKNRIWSKLWVRKDEFHSSLNLDVESMLYKKIPKKLFYNSKYIM